MLTISRPASAAYPVNVELRLIEVDRAGRQAIDLSLWERGPAGWHPVPGRCVGLRAHEIPKVVEALIAAAGRMDLTPPPRRR